MAARALYSASLPQCAGDGRDRLGSASLLPPSARPAADDLPAAPVGVLAVVSPHRHPDVHLRRRDHEPLRNHDPASQSRRDPGRAHVRRAGADQRFASDADGLRVRLRQRGRRDAVQDARRADGAPRLSAPVRRGDRRRLRGDHADDAARPRLRAVRLSRQRFGGQAVHGGHRARLHHDDRPHGHHALSLEALRLPAGSRPNGLGAAKSSARCGRRAGR